jgi:hypothetical protein
MILIIIIIIIIIIIMFNFYNVEGYLSVNTELSYL